DCPHVIARYSHPEMARIWSDDNKFATWLRVELASTEALAERGVVPKAALETIRKKAKVDPAHIEAIEAEVQHDVIAFVSDVAESVGAEGRWLHYGLTSSDVVDTALAINMRDACAVIQGDITELMAAVRDRAYQYKDAPIVGRTHGVH